MPVQKTDRTTTWFLNEYDKTWTLARDAKITVDGQAGIRETAGNSEIYVFGDIRASNTLAGVFIDSSDTELNIGQESRINAKQAANAVYSGAAGAEIVNRGFLEGEESGIRGAIWSDITNYGTIRGSMGISHNTGGSTIYNHGTIDASGWGITELAGGNHIVNGRKGVISGDAAGIFLQESGDARIINHGLLRGDAAIYVDGGDQHVTNTGRIVGTVQLGAGEDIFDSRQGSVNGKVYGGLGDDDYYIGKAAIKLIEFDNAGRDSIYSTVSHTLRDNFEVLTLLGKKDLNGTGNAQANWLHGNAGDNRLNGGAGADLLTGGGGDDTLRGGGGNDVFVFNRAGIDRIVDFQDGADRLVITGVTSQADFDALNISRVDGDLIISFGGGNRIIIDDLRKSDFTYMDDVTLL